MLGTRHLIQAAVTDTLAEAALAAAGFSFKPPERDLLQTPDWDA